VAVFDNRFPSLSPDAPPEVHGLVAGSTGRCQVLVYTDDHALRSITELPLPQLVDLLAVLRERTAALWAEGHLYVMAFENHGVEVGPPSATCTGRSTRSATFRRPWHEARAARAAPPLRRAPASAARSSPRTGASERVVAPNDSFTVAVPFGPRWPLEVHLRAVEHGVRRLADLSDDQLLDLARALADVVGRFDALYDIDLPYMLCVQEAPAPAAGSVEDWHLHVELLPPHRSANRLKVRASVETALGVFINDTWPEEVAARLRDEVVADADWSGVEVPVIRAVP
jgi:UDPglucose--hexose-1-phosphate uridylyltransferase